VPNVKVKNYLLGFLVGIGGCQQPTLPELVALHKEIVAKGIQQVPIVADFDRLYPGSEHFVTHFTEAEGPPVWRSEAGIYGRYILDLELPIDIDKKKNVKPRGDWTLKLREVREIGSLPDGRLNILMGETFPIKPNDWERIKQNSGDIAPILPVHRDRPVVGFELHWKKI
jgi:hypothetical protein